MSEPIKSSIAGVFSYPNAKAPMKAMAPGDAFKFEAEPTNIHDKNAIALYAPTMRPAGSANPTPGWEKCGYLPRVLTVRLTTNRISAIVKGEDKFDSIVITLTE